MLGTLLTIVALIVLLVAFVALVGPLRNLLVGKLDAQEYELLKSLALMAVGWAEKWLNGKTGEEKKEEVFVYLIDVCDNLGLVVDQMDIDKAIESAVYEIKK